jgi:uncharacterized protein YecT (DUF1311 family)
MSRSVAARYLWKIAVTVIASQFLVLPSFAQEEVGTADARLNQVYQALRSRLTESGKTSLRTVQRSWVAFKEKDFPIFSSCAKAADDSPRASRYLVEETDFRTEYLTMLAKSGKREERDDEVKTARQADQMLNSIYRECLSLLPSNKIAAFKESQTLWIQFRDLHCQFDAAIRGRADDAELRDTTMRRVVDLRHYMMVLVAEKLPVPGDGTIRDDEDQPTPGLPPLNPFRFAK